MEDRIRSRFDETILRDAQQRYGIDPEQMEELAGFESFIYGYRKTERRYVLRLGHSLRRSPDLIRGEVDWMNHLAAGGAGVASAVPSDAGNLVEVIDDGQGESFLATSFVWAAGGPVRQMGGWTESFMRNYGRLLGRLHALTKRYSPSNDAWKRPSWDHSIMTDATSALPQLDPTALKRGGENLAYLRLLPTDSSSFGLIHQDAHTGNLFVDEAGRITLFDFDDCVYGHFINDISIVLFYAVTNREDPEVFCAQFWPLFWEGYCEENELDSVWIEEILPFMKLREIDLYGIIRRDLPAWRDDTWLAGFMEGRQKRIREERPYLEFDFTLVLAE